MQLRFTLDWEIAVGNVLKLCSYDFVRSYRVYCCQFFWSLDPGSIVENNDQNYD